MRTVVSVPSSYNASKLEAGKIYLAHSALNTYSILSDMAQVGDKVGVDVWVESYKPQSSSSRD